MIKRAIHTIYITVVLVILLFVAILSLITSPIQYILFGNPIKIIEITGNFFTKIERKIVDFYFSNKTINDRHM